MTTASEGFSQEATVREDHMWCGVGDHSCTVHGHGFRNTHGSFSVVPTVLLAVSRSVPQVQG
jgi:hypothetical protein